MQNNKSMRNYVIEMLGTELRREYSYHDLAHTLYVTDKAIEIAQYEGCREEDLRLIEAAGLWHDAGYITSRHDHEQNGCALFRDHAAQFNFTAEETEQICNMIMATKIPQSPKNYLDEILADADLEYLGTEHAEKTAHKLYLEILHFNPAFTHAEWLSRQIKFIGDHHYFTKWCKANREEAKAAYLQKLREEANIS